jgi:hypothetical protein
MLVMDALNVLLQPTKAEWTFTDFALIAERRWKVRNDMRLIDADELKMYDNKPCYTKIRKYQMDNHLEVLDSFSIDNVSTVETIPMSVIEEIKAEIEHIVGIHSKSIFGEGIYSGYKSGLYDALAIIDKHIAESEDKE